MSPAQIEDHKRILRQQLRRSLKQISVREKDRKSRIIARKIFKSTWFQEAQNIYLFYSLPGEVKTRPIIQRALQLKKNVFLPVVLKGHNVIRFYGIENLQKDLQSGLFGIREPRRIKKRLGLPRRKDVMIIPGLGFDLKGRRLGRGGGYFDKYLCRKKAFKIGIVYREQIVPRIPVNRKDQAVDILISD